MLHHKLRELVTHDIVARTITVAPVENPPTVDQLANEIFPTQWPSPRGSWLALDALSTVYNTKVVDFWHLTTSDSAHALSTLKIHEWDVQFWNLELWNLTPWHLWDHWPGHFVTGWLSQSSAVILKPPSILAEIDLIWMVATYDVPKLRVCFMYINMYDCKYVYIYIHVFEKIHNVSWNVLLKTVLLLANMYIYIYNHCTSLNKNWSVHVYVHVCKYICIYL